ncbi:MAG: hypothetical protein IKA61_05885 [Clostridia bacterium]|nr:hypothetical protein [Clostridia bacterium]
MAKLSEDELRQLLEKAYNAKNEGGSLSKVFESFAQKTGRAKGSVRNVYYLSLKQMQEDKGYMNKMLGKNRLDVTKIISFDEGEASLLLERILIGVTFGKSVRRVINEMTDSPKLALRYQNKYRNLLKLERERVEKTVQKIKDEYGKCYDPYKKPMQDGGIYERLKKEINSLCDRIASDVKEENARLKQRVSELESKNKRLEEALSKAVKTRVEDYFSQTEKESI